jgi:hypothetical protein
VKLFQWRGRTSKKAFTDRFQAAIQQHLPDTAIEQTAELELRVTRAGGFTQTVWLSRAYEEFCQAPAKADATIARWLQTVVNVGAETALDADRIIPVVKAQRWLAENAQNGFDPWTEPYNTELIIVFAEYRNGLSYCDRKRFEDLRIPATQLRDRAFANLRRVITQVSVTGEEGEYLLGAGGTIDASLLLIDDVMKDPRIELAGEPLVAVSDRDSFWVADDANPFAVFGVAASVARCYRSAPYPISRQLFRRAGAIWEPLDPHVVDESHPIPKLNVIDIIGTRRGGGADLVVIVASPLGADARSVFRLCTKLDGYLHEIGTEEWRQEHGAPTPESTRILLNLHPQSDPVIPKMLDSYRGWAQSRGARLCVEGLDLKG